MNNYRPISIISTFSKILENFIKKRITSYIKKNILYYTLGITVDFSEYIIQELDQNKYVVAVFVDQQKAFDTVDIGHLMNNFEKMDFRGVAQ